jgi:hypothetical protein
MPRIIVLTILALTALSRNPASAQTAVYQPFGDWIDPQQAALSQWEANRRIHIAASVKPVRAESRPQLAGLRPREVELLEEALARKSPKKIATIEKAQRHIMRLSRNQVGRNLLNGTMHEALFIERNPEWGYVKSANAPQHDVYRWHAGGKTPFNGQLKFHVSGNPETYAASMAGDKLAHSFFIPDDHVEGVRHFLRAKAERLAAAENLAGSNSAWRDYGRIRGSGVTTAEVIGARRYVTKYETRQRYATYTSLGASLALAAGPTIWDWANGDLPANQAVYRTTRTLNVLGVGVVTDLALTRIWQGALRGTMRGNLIVGTAALITDTTWLLHEHGWRKALATPVFYESVAGSAGGLALGLAAGFAAVVWVPGAGWVAGGAAVVSSAIAGTVGYMGGRSATHMLFEILAPEKLQQRQRDRIAEVNLELQRRIAKLQDLEDLAST